MQVPKTSRYTLSVRIDSLFIEILELIAAASFLPPQQKLPLIQKTSVKLDMIKFFLQIMWEVKALDNKKYILLSKNVDEIGRMLGGWQKQLLTKNSANGGE